MQFSASINIYLFILYFIFGYKKYRFFSRKEREKVCSKCFFITYIFYNKFIIYILYNISCNSLKCSEKKASKFAMWKYFREHESVIFSRKDTWLASISSSNNPGEQFKRHCTRHIDCETTSLAFDGWCDETKDYPNNVSWFVQSQFRRVDHEWDQGSFQRVG